MPEVGTDLLGHPDTIAGIAGAAGEIHRVDAEILELHRLALFKAAGAQNHRPGGPDIQLMRSAPSTVSHLYAYYPARVIGQ